VEEINSIRLYIVIGVLIGIGIYAVDEIHWRYFGSERLEIIQRSLDSIKESYPLLEYEPPFDYPEEKRPEAQPSGESASGPDLLRPTPYFVNGEIQGYRVYPGSDRTGFRSLGLRPGDLVTEIDGQPLNKTEVATELFQRAISGQPVQVGVLRGDELEIIEIKVD